VCTADLGFTGGKNDIGAGTDTDFIGACTPALTMSFTERSLEGMADSIATLHGADIRYQNLQ